MELDPDRARGDCATGRTSYLLPMPDFFPRHSVAWKLEEPAAFRRLSLSLVEMAAITGVVLRLLRPLVLARAGTSWAMVGAFYAGIAVLICLMATAHLGNYPVRQWLWRAPAFVGIEVAAEMLTSLVLIALRRETLGATALADFHDWPAMAVRTLIYRFGVVATFALALAGVVQLVRYLLLRHEHRDHTVAAVHEERVREEAEQHRHALDDKGAH
jgi:hypothetical protein